MAEKIARDIQVYDGSAWRSLRAQKVYDGSDWKDFHGVYDGTDWYKLSSTTEYSGFYLVGNGEIINQHTTDTWDGIFGLNVGKINNRMIFSQGSVLRLVNRAITGKVTNLHIEYGIVKYKENNLAKDWLWISDTSTFKNILITENMYGGANKSFSVKMNNDIYTTDSIDFIYRMAAIDIDFIKKTVTFHLVDGAGDKLEDVLSYDQSLDMTPNEIDIGYVASTSPIMELSGLYIKATVKQ